MKVWTAALMACVVGACATDRDGDFIDHPPAVVAAPAMTTEDTPLDIRVQLHDPDGDPMVLAVGLPAHGTLVQNGVDLRYTPAADYVGADQIPLTVSTPGAEVTSMIEIEVTAVDDPPRAFDDELSVTAAGIALIATQALLANDIDVDGDALALVAVSNPSVGTVGIAAGNVELSLPVAFTGKASFRYTISDGNTTASATATVDVTRPNDPPVAADDVAVTDEDVALIVLGSSLVGNDIDPDGDPLAIVGVFGAQHGSVALYGTTVVFTPAADYAGPASFSYTVSDGSATSAGTVSITVLPVDDPPRAAGDFYDTVEDTPFSVLSSALLANDLEVDLEPMTVVSVVSQFGGVASLVNGTITFTPAANFHGIAAFYYVVQSGSLSGSATVSVRVASVPDDPVATDEQFVTVRDRPLAIGAAGLLLNDFDGDGDAISLTSVGNALHGTVTLDGARVSFVPESGFEGPASFEYTIEDASGATASATVAIEVVSPLGVVAGARHSCALLAGGVVKCWGDAASGQLGLGNITRIGDNAGEMGAVLAAVDLGIGRTATKITAGAFHTCALLDDATVKCWGSGAMGALGSGSTALVGDGPDEMGDLLAPVSLGTGRTAVDIDAGTNHTCAVLDTGVVKCWGSNSFGQLGLGDTVTRGTAGGQMGDALPAVELGTGRTATAVVAGNDHTCALLDDATVKCWGGNASGQLGLGDSTRRGDNAGEMGDALMPVNLGSGRTAFGVEVGSSFSCALLDNLAVKCWGVNSSGQLGIGNTATRGTSASHMGNNLAPIQLGTGRTARRLSLGNAHTCVVLDNGSLKCWGLSSKGQCGHGDTITRGDSPFEMGDGLPAVVLGGGAALFVSAGQEHTCAVLADSSMKCWGDNTYGQLGQGDVAARGDGPNEMGAFLLPISL